MVSTVSRLVRWVAETRPGWGDLRLVSETPLGRGASGRVYAVVAEASYPGIRKALKVCLLEDDRDVREWEAGAGFHRRTVPAACAAAFMGSFLAPHPTNRTTPVKFGLVLMERFDTDLAQHLAIDADAGAALYGRLLACLDGLSRRDDMQYDLKPANVVLDLRGDGGPARVALVDFDGRFLEKASWFSQEQRYQALLCIFFINIVRWPEFTALAGLFEATLQRDVFSQGPTTHIGDLLQGSRVFPVLADSYFEKSHDWPHSAIRYLDDLARRSGGGVLRPVPPSLPLTRKAFSPWVA